MCPKLDFYRGACALAARLPPWVSRARTPPLDLSPQVELGCSPARGRAQTDKHLAIAIRLRPDATSRWGSAVLVLLLHLALLLALLRAVIAPINSPTKEQETILRLMPQLKSEPAQKAAPPAMASPQLRIPVVPLVPPPLATAPAPDLSGFGRRLFGCAPENLSNLSREERANCSTGLTRPDANAMIEPRSHVKDPSRRAAEMATKNTPGRIPCTYITSAPAPHGTAPAPMIDTGCTIGGLSNGFGPLNGLPK